MEKYDVYIKPSALKEIEALSSKKDRQAIVNLILSLRNDPRPVGCRKLSGSEKYRIRHGSYRILYSIEDQKLTVYVVRVGHRKDVYRQAI